MPKHYKDMIDELINKMDEDAPANAVAHGGVDMATNAGRHSGAKAKNNKKEYRAKNKDAENILKNLIMKRMGNAVKENHDNNNVVLRGINETLNRLEAKIDEKSGNDEEVEIKQEKKTFHDKFMKDLMDNTPHSGQFDEDI